MDNIGLDESLEEIEEDYPLTASERWPYINQDFLDQMQDILELGITKYGKDSFEGMLEENNLHRTRRTNIRAIQDHIFNHGQQYIDGIPHDVFHTRSHQLAAQAVNAMMEFVFHTELELNNEC